MTVKHEIKSQLAKLLATEDLVVEHKNVETAQFNVHTRVLQLPNWNTSNRVYDALVSHEVGHALFTPDVDPPRHIPHTFINITEDARIEKLMKRKYMGLAKTFYRGYNELADNDFFEIEGKDVDSLNLADRVNLHFKIGSFVNISFSSTETPIVNLVKNAETFEEALSAAEALYNFCKQGEEESDNESSGQNQQLSIEQQPSPSGGSSTGDSDTDSTDDIDSPIPNTNGDDTLEGGNSGFNNPSRGDDSATPLDLEPETQTVNALDKKLRELAQNSSLESVYVEIPKVNLDKIIVDNKILHERIRKEWEDSPTVDFEGCVSFEEVDSKYREFKKNAQKEVNYLVKEFECKKSADAYARATTSKTGVLNTSLLHTYKFNEDLFKKITVIPDGKSHGLVFILDWSGSMQGVIEDTLKQLYNLIWFCKKVNIPFEVYAFTFSYPLWTEEDGVRHSVYEKKEGFLQLVDNFSLMQFFTSNVNSKTLEEQMLNIYRIAYTFTNYTQYKTPLGLDLSGTPLNDTIMALHQILPRFKEEHKLQKVQCVILTDGEAGQLTYHKEVQRDWEDSPYLGCGYVHRNSVLRDRKLGTTYTFNVDGWAQITDQLLRNLKDKFTDMNLIGIRLLSPRDGNSFIRRYHFTECKEFDRLLKDWKKDKAFAIKESGYDTYFGLSSAALANDDEFQVQEDATKAQIKRAFVKSLKSKKMNKKVLSEFVELVA
jgi:hypothetical protein